MKLLSIEAPTCMKLYSKVTIIYFQKSHNNLTLYDFFFETCITLLIKMMDKSLVINFNIEECESQAGITDFYL